MMPVTVLLDLKTKTKQVNKNHLIKNHLTTSMLLGHTSNTAVELLPIGQQCVFVNVT